MGSRDKSRRETKKPKKDTTKITTFSVMAPPPEVQVIKKGKQRDGRRAEEEVE